MKPARFSYAKARSLDDVFALFAAHGEDAKIVAGGQSLAPMMNLRMAQPAVLVDINAVPGLDFVRLEGDRLALGPLLRHHDLARNALVRAHCPILAHAAETIGHYAIRQRGSLGGSLSHADPAAQLPLVAMLLGAGMELASARGTRGVAARDFLVSIFTTALEPDEVLSCVRIPVLEPGEGWGFRLFNRRAGDFAIVAAAATLLRGPDGRVARLRLALGGVGPVPVRLDDVGQAAVGAVPDPGWAAAVAETAARSLELEDDPRVAAAFRRDLAAALVRGVLEDAIGRSV